MFDLSITRLKVVCCLLVWTAMPMTVSSFAQDPAGEISQQEIQNRLNEILKSLPEDETAASEAPSGSSSVDDQPTEMVDPEIQNELPVGLIAELESRIADLSARDRSREEGQQLNQLKLELKVAKTIAKQLNRTRLVREKKDPAQKGPDNSFVIARIDVPANSSEAEVTFVSMEGEQANTESLFEFLKATPPGNYRDYWIVSRHGSASSAEQALTVTRQEYDARKEREEKILAYIAARNQQMARVKRSRRC